MVFNEDRPTNQTNKKHKKKGHKKKKQSKSIEVTDEEGEEFGKPH